MKNKLDDLLILMNQAREEADRASSLAYSLRQEAVKTQFEATAAADTATITAQLLSECTDLKMRVKLARFSRETIRKTIEATEKAAKAVMDANKADLLATNAFMRCSEAAQQLTIILDETEKLFQLQHQTD